MHLCAKTNQSAHLRSGPGIDHPFIDALEPNYPLRITGPKTGNGWWPVLALAKGPRTRNQVGYIYAKEVDVEEPPKPDDPCEPIDWVLWGSILGGAVIIAALVTLISASH